MCGCWPTDEQVLAYEAVLAVTGLGLGLAMWALGRRIGRRWCHHWFVCSYCLQPQPASVPDAQMQSCPACGRRSSVNHLSRADARRLGAAGKTVLLPSRRRVAVSALLLTLLTLALLSIPGLVIRQVWPAGPPWPTEDENWILFPLTFIATEMPQTPALGWGWCFFNFDLFVLIAEQVEDVVRGDIAENTTCYVGLVLLLALHWYAGLRRWRRGWLLPVALQAFNVGFAVMAYFCLK